MPFPREEVEAAVQQYVKDMAWMSNGGDALVIFERMFTEDVVYVEHAFGTVRGRKAVLDWVASLIAEHPILTDIKLRIDWHMIEGNRVVVYHHDGFPDPRGGAPFEVPIVTIMEYAGGGRWSYEEDLYDTKKLDSCIAGYMAAKAEVAAKPQAN